MNSAAEGDAVYVSKRWKRIITNARKEQNRVAQQAYRKQTTSHPPGELPTIMLPCRRETKRTASEKGEQQVCHTRPLSSA
jgi:hypothetical protein